MTWYKIFLTFLIFKQVWCLLYVKRKRERKRDRVGERERERERVGERDRVGERERERVRYKQIERERKDRMSHTNRSRDIEVG